jgi:integrase
MAAIETLTDKAIKAAIKTAVAESKARPLSDGGGLSLLIQPSGAGWWRLRYWLDSRENRLSLGTYPAVGLATARERRRDALKLIAAGTDPSAERKADKKDRKAQIKVEQLAARGEALPGTFKAVACEWMTTVHQAKVSAGHAERTKMRFEQDVFPYLGTTPIATIEAPELLRVLRKICERGAIETAHRIKYSCGQVFRFGIASGYCKRDPAADLRDALPPVPTRHHAAIIDPQRAAELFRDMAEYRGTPVVRTALVLSALLFQRPGEIRHLEWSWVDFDAALIEIPASQMKRTKDQKVNGQAHIVPLAPQAIAALSDLKPLTGHGRYVFPNFRSRERCMSEVAVLAAIRRMGYGKEDMTPHGFRAMARTMARERLKISNEVIELQLAHAVADPLGGAYNRVSLLDERRELMVKWADYLDRLREGAEVITFPTRAA